MKLLIILSIEEYINEVHRILVSQHIPIYSETEIRGCRSDTKDKAIDLSNWFANTDIIVYSHPFFAFQDKDSVENIFQK